MSSSAVAPDNRVTLDSKEDEGQQIVLPFDIYKEFEAARSQVRLL